LYNKGNALNKLNKYDESVKAYDEAIEINPHLRSLVR
jgi:tetratricopeptide (TPR) repeat protein